MKCLNVLLLFSVLIFIPSVSAAISQGQPADISHSVRVDGGEAPAGTSCNITIFFANDTKLVDFQEMTRGTGAVYNYSLNQTQTAIKGDYTYDVTCVSPDNRNSTQSFSMSINYGGIDPSESRTGATSRAIYIVFGLAILSFLAFMYFQKEVIKYTFFLMAILFVVITINFLFLGFQDEVVNPKVEAFFSAMTAISFYIYWFIAALIFILWLFAFINTTMQSMKEKKSRKFGYG